MFDKGFWDDRYREDGFAYGVEPNDFLKEQTPKLSHVKRVLSIGEGEGRNAVYLASLGCQVHCIDISPVGLDKTRQLAKSTLVTTQVVDLKDFIKTSADKWDLIINIWCHVPSDLRKQLHAWIPTALSPNGLYLLEAYHPSNIGRGTGGPQAPDLCLDLSDLDDLRLTALIAENKERNIQEGKYHSGLSAVTRYVGKLESTDS